MADYPVTAANRARRLRERISYDTAVVHSILDEALICHVGVADAGPGGPLVLPMIHARLGDSLYLHASTGSGLLLRGLPAPVCVTATIVDGLVLAKSQFAHSMNYRSVVVRGPATEVTDPGERDRALTAIVEHVSPGRSSSSRPPDQRELAATAVVRVSMESVSAKVRTGGPHDGPEDADLDHWSGVVPMRLTAAAPVPDPAAGKAPPPRDDPRFRP